MMNDITLRMTGNDFQMLAVNSMAWAGTDWQNQEGRFATLPFNSSIIAWNFTHAYWFDTWADVILARAFLAAADYAHQVLSDGGAAGRERGFLIVTDYATSTRRDAED